MSGLTNRFQWSLSVRLNLMFSGIKNHVEYSYSNQIVFVEKV